MRPLWSVWILIITGLSFIQGSAVDVSVRARGTWDLEVRVTERGRDASARRSYQIQIARNENFDVAQMEVNAEVGVRTLTWIWTSTLPLPCADHSARARRVLNDKRVGSWSQWVTNHGQQNNSSNTILIFPKQEVLKNGSTATFCCIPPAGSKVVAMKFKNNLYQLIQLDAQVWAIEVPKLNITPFPTLSCDDNAGRKKTELNYITFPPERPQNLRCETRDLRRIVCSWTPGTPPNLSGLRRRNYTLLIQDHDGKEIPCDWKSCVFSALPNRTYYNITVLVRNSLGEESQSDQFNVTDRTFPVPEYISVAAGVMDAEVSWSLNGNFVGLQLICQIELEPTGATTELSVIGREVQHVLSVRLQQLQPGTQYSIRGHCAVQGGGWGAWTSSSSFNTEPLVTVDVWRRLEGQDDKRKVTVLWRNFTSGSHSNILGYEVCMEQKDTQRRVCVNASKPGVGFMVGAEAWNVTVRAVIGEGLSLTSRIDVPAFHQEPAVEEKRIWGNAQGFNLTWNRLSAATCGYLVEWSTAGSVEPWEPQWRKVSANQTSCFFPAEVFRKGRRYTFQIFSCHAEEHQIYEKQIGYLEEQTPLQVPKVLHSLSVSWSSVNLEWSFDEEDPVHPGFITGYRVTVQRDSSWDSIHSRNISVDNPHSKSVQVEDLQERQQYTFRLAACTSVGCGLEETRRIGTLRNYYLLLAKVLTPLLFLISCCLCLFPCRKTLKGIAVDVFIFPNDQTLNRLKLDDKLYEVSEKIRVLRIDDCTCCDLEIVSERSSLETSWPLSSYDTTHLFVSPKLGDSSFANLKPTWVDPDALVCDDLTDETVTDVTNLTYLSSPQDTVPPDTLPDTLEPVEVQHQHQHALDSLSTDYVTTITMAQM